ncbi:neutral amino acid transporter [Lunasporangiospora selenospora]|uniref:Neutral amino acid transporter n=1 Tax=Lunasporangiospora selenospora TaxID=979761 RepID=A0A9P6KE76_9FUNG|nr:neutral amino acid transporter [Lunasporangiospora selenospora]
MEPSQDGPSQSRTNQPPDDLSQPTKPFDNPFTPNDPDHEEATSMPGGNGIGYDPNQISRARSTKRLAGGPGQSGNLSVDTAADGSKLHSIVGQHLVLSPSGKANTPTSPMGGVMPPPGPLDPVPLDPYASVAPDYIGPVSTAPLTVKSRLPPGASDMDLGIESDPHSDPRSSDPEKQQRLSVGIDSISGVDDSASSQHDAASHFNLLGADVSHDVYKWHEKETRRQVGRSHTYHNPLDTKEDDPEISNIKAPGGFRRHFIQQDAATRGGPEPHFPSKSFIHFLGMFNLYEFDHFAGENFHSIPRRSIVVPKDIDRRRKSLAETLYSERKVFTPGQAIADDEIVIVEPQEKISFSKALGMLFKTFIASGILFLPNAFKNGGILFSSLVMTLIAVLCLHSFLLLVKCRDIHPGSYGDIGQHFYGRWMRYIVLFAIAISQFGFCCGYCIFFAQQFAIVVDSLGGAYLDKIVWIAIFFVILVPFTFVRNISKLGFSTIVADICIIVGLVYIYVYDIKELVINHGAPPPGLRLFNGQDFGLFIGTAVFSYEGIGMVIPICSSMAEPKQFPRALTIVLSVVCVLLVSFGALGYAAYGENVQTIVLDDLPNQTGGEKAGKNAIQLLYIIAIFLTTPLMLFPCIRIVEHAVFSIINKGGMGTEVYTGRPASWKFNRAQWMKENVVRVIVDFAVAAVAYAGYTKLDIFISFVGSFACAPLLFIFPPLFHLKAFPGNPMWRKLCDIALILFGLLVFCYTLVVTIQNFSGH